MGRNALKCTWCDQGHELSGGYHNVFIGPKQYEIYECQKSCPHKWKWHSRDGDYHDLHHCPKCDSYQSRKL